MAIIRYNPWQEINHLQSELNRIFDEGLSSTSLTEFGNLSKIPAAELVETDEALVLKLEVPGMNASDLDIEVTAKTVSISGERKLETRSEDKNRTRLSEDVPYPKVYPLGQGHNISFRTEFRYGRFQRVIPLPRQIKNTEVKAEYKAGILHLTLPKAEAEKNKVVKVNLNGADA